MREYRILSYKARLDGHPLDDLIQAHSVIFNPWSWNKPSIWCSHKEIWIPNSDNNYDLGQCWTSTLGQAGGKNRRPETGVVCRPANEILFHPERWYYQTVSCSDYGYEMMLEWMHIWLSRNRGYNKADIADFFNPFYRTQDLEKFICSGFCWAAFVVSQNPIASDAIELARASGHMITELPSPLRMTQWTYEHPHCGPCVDLKTNCILLEKNNRKE